MKVFSFIIGMWDIIFYSEDIHIMVKLFLDIQIIIEIYWLLKFYFYCIHGEKKILNSNRNPRNFYINTIKEDLYMREVLQSNILAVRNCSINKWKKTSQFIKMNSKKEIYFNTKY